MQDSASSSFARIVAAGEAELNLAAAALHMARVEYPELDVAAYLERLDAMAADARRDVPDGAGPVDALLALNRYLFQEQGFAGNRDDYYDPRNSFLNEVLDRRTGIPITLSLVYLELGRRLGLTLDGVSFPGHFLVKLRLKEGEAILDPFNGGYSLSIEDLERRAREAATDVPATAEQVEGWLSAAPKRDILLRMLANLQRVYEGRRDHLRAVRQVDLALVLEPGSPALLRARGSHYEALGHVSAAAGAYQGFLERVAEGPEADAVRERLLALAGGQAGRVH
jgi:regulator of sirC expression with transglutaminase-like and TPR domain